MLCRRQARAQQREDHGGQEKEHQEPHRPHSHQQGGALQLPHRVQHG